MSGLGSRVTADHGRPAASGPRTRAGVPARTEPDPPPASAAWREGDHPGRRQFVPLGDLPLESGQTLPGVRIAYETWGRLSPARDNAVLVLHALTGDSHVHGEAGPGHPSPGWWNSLVGPGAPLDTERYFVVAPNILGGCQGSTGPASSAPDGRPWGSRFPRVTTRDQVAAEIALTDYLQIPSWALVIGASLGGHRVLEWAVTTPDRVRAIAAIATAAATSADQIAWAHPQLAAIRLDPEFAGGDYYDAPESAGPHRGLAIARQIAHTTYRSAVELDTRFGRQAQPGEDPLTGGQFAVQSYLDHHGNKLLRRFDANSYLAISGAMLTHDVGRGRGGVMAALSTVSARAVVVAVDSDRLFPQEQGAQIAHAIPRADPLRVIHSPYGHDGFLIEADQLGRIVTDFMRASGT